MGHGVLIKGHSFQKSFVINCHLDLQEMAPVSPLRAYNYWKKINI